MIEDNTELAVRYSILVDNVEHEVYGTLTNDCYKDGNIIGNFIAKTFTFETTLDLKDKEYKVSMLVNDDKLVIGTFITIDIEANDTTKINKVYAMDYELKSQIEYTSNLPYSSGNVTLGDVWQECCNLCGVQNGSLTFNNSDFIVDSDQFTGTGTTVHGVMVEVARCSMDFIITDADDKYTLQLTNPTQYIIQDYVELQDKRDTQPITVLIYGQANITGQEGIYFDSELVEQYGEHKLTINDSLFAYTTEKREYFAISNYDKIKLFGYSSFVAKDTFMPYLKLGDKVKFKTSDGTLTDSIVLRKSERVELGGVEFSVEAPSITTTTVDYKAPVSSPIEAIKKVEITANQALNEARIAASEVVPVTKTITSYDTVHMTDTMLNYNGLIGNLVIKPIQRWNFLYPSDDLFIKELLKPSLSLYPNLQLYPNNGESDLYPVEVFITIQVSEEVEFLEPFEYTVDDTLRWYNGVADTFEIIENQAKIVKRIGTDETGNPYILPTPIEKALGEVILPTYESNTYLRVLSQPNTEIRAQYVLKNEYTKVFATEIYVNNEIITATEGILLEASSYTDKQTEADALVASLNLLPTGNAKLLATKVLDLQGETINLTADDVTIESTDFKVDKDGHVTMTGATIEDGSISINEARGDAIEVIVDEEAVNVKTRMAGGAFTSWKDNYWGAFLGTVGNKSNYGQLILYGENEVEKVSVVAANNGSGEIAVRNANGEITASMAGFNGTVRCIDLIETSQEKNKKNFELLKSGLDIIKDIDIYKYNLKTDEKNAKKHIGFVIGDDYKYSKELTNEDNTGVNAYAIASVCIKAIQEQQKQIEELKAIIKEMK